MKEVKFENRVFVPDKFVPLSTFDSAEEGTEQTFEVSPAVLKHLKNDFNELMVAQAREDGITFRPVTGVDYETGKVTAPVERGCSHTIVAKAFRNHFPVVTHWDSEGNSGTGCWHPGACDGIGVLDVDLEKDAVTAVCATTDSDPENPYWYFSGRYDLFSSPGENQLHRVPAYERYIGESYSLMKVTDRLAVWLSDKALRQTGFPIIYLNDGDRPQQDLPIFQVVSNRQVAYDLEYPSLVTFILPPYWTPKPENLYPALFTGFYDSNDNVFRFSGLSFINILGRCQKELGTSAVGILWNGGGSGACRTLQLSAYHNLSALFALAEKDYGVDRNFIVAAGGSRGGITTLAAAGNPYHDDYRIRYVVCYNPIVYFGEKDMGMMTPTTPMIYAVASDDTGYRYAWRPDWREPGTGLSGEELLLENLIGTRQPAIANEVLSPYSPVFARKMKERGTQVLLFVGTHDGFATKDPMIDMAEGLLAAGVPLHLQIGYRWGHGAVDNLDERAGQLLLAAMRGEEVRLEGVSHYRRIDGAPGTFPVPEKMEPLHQPIFFEGPRLAAFGDHVKLNVVGPANTKCRLILTKINDGQWTQKQQVSVEGTDILLIDCALPEITRHLQGEPSYFRKVLLLDEKFAEGYYLYECSYCLPGSDEWILLKPENTPHLEGPKVPVFQVVREYPWVSGQEIALQLCPNCLGWGLCEV